MCESARGAAPPQTIDIERQYVVEQIIARRNGREHFADSEGR
jgi:hypothetical protein